MAYVPPALRKKNNAASESPQDRVEPAKSWKGSVADESGLLNLQDIQDHFWPRQEPVNDISEEEDTNPQESTRDPGNRLSFASVHKHSTLNGTAEEPDQLKYLLLFHGANPRWAKDNVIFAKTNLRLLQKSTAKTDTSPTPLAELEPDTAEQSSDLSTTHVDQDNTKSAGETSSKTTTTPVSLPVGPIHIFEETRKGYGATFTFSGYYTLTNLEILEPNSPALVRMLDQKWTATNSRGFSRTRQRDPESWKRSLGQQWAVLKFEKDKKSTVELLPPQIEASTTKTSRPWRAQSVNEILQELRLKDMAGDVKRNGEDT